MTVEQAGALLRHANEYQLLPYVSIGLFAGLRSAELLRLDAGAIKLSENSIVVSAEVAKKRSRRVVEICAALHEWLKLCKGLKGPIVDTKEFTDNWRQLKAAAGIDPWPHNALRHSFGSYHLSQHRDAIKTATQMGHRSSDVVHNHYKALVMNSEAEKFWNLKPEKEKPGTGNSQASAPPVSPDGVAKAEQKS